MNLLRKLRPVMVAGAVLTLFGSMSGIAPAETAAPKGGPHYYILVGGTCDGNAGVYDQAWLQGGIRKVVQYPAGAAGLPGCDQTPMDQSVAAGHTEGDRVVQEAFGENPGAEFTVVGYSQGAIVADMMLDDIADGKLGVDKSRFSAKLYADPMQPVGPQSRGISAVLPAGTGAPSPFGGYVSFGPGRTDFGGIPYIRYCIETDGVCNFETPEAPGGYFAQHQCYQWLRPDDHRSIMGDTLADGVYDNASTPLGRQNCHPPTPPA